MEYKLWTLLVLLTVCGCHAVLSDGDADTDDEEYHITMEGDTIEDLGIPSRPVPKCNIHHTSPRTCQNFARYSVNQINQQIRMELNASYTYLAMAKYFSRDDVSYRGFAQLFQSFADEERDHAQKFMDYMNKRGGRIELKAIPDPKAEWETPLEALRDALGLEHDVNSVLLSMHGHAQSKNDPHLQHFLESEFLGEQVESIKRLADYITIMSRLEGYSIGWHIFDEQLTQGTR